MARIRLLVLGENRQAVLAALVASMDENTQEVFLDICSEYAQKNAGLLSAKAVSYQNGTITVEVDDDEAMRYISRTACQVFGLPIR